MKTLRDFEGRLIRLTDERLRHILEHPEMSDMSETNTQTLEHPEVVVRSQSDVGAHLYYRVFTMEHESEINIFVLL